MAFSKAKVKSMITNGKKIAGDLMQSGKVIRTLNPMLLEDGTYAPEQTKVFKCDVLETGISDTRDSTDIVRPTDTVVYAFNLGIRPLQGTDILEYGGNQYIIVLAYDESVGTNQLHKLIVRMK